MRRRALVEILLTHGANCDARTNGGLTPADVAADEGIKALLRTPAPPTRG